MNKWKNLQIDNLPPDILTGDYEFEHRKNKDAYWESSIYTENRLEIFECMIKYGEQYRYRKPEPKAPSHEDWERIRKGYDKIHADFNECWQPARDAVDKMVKEMTEFIKSATIPPEAT